MIELFLVVPLGLIFWTIAICLIVYVIKENKNDR